MPANTISILTPEHVEIRLVPAGLGSRFLAWIVDFFFILGICGIIYYAAASLAFMSMALTSILIITVCWAVMWGYHVFFEMLWQGRTPGKTALRLRVVDDRGLPLNFQQSVTRNIVRVIDMQPGICYGLGALVCLLDSAHRRCGDIAGGTLVVRDAQRVHVPATISQSQQFNSLRVPRVLRMIRTRVSLDEREFLLALCLRAPQLNDRAKFDLMENVGAYYREKLKVDDANLSGENLVRGLTAILFEKRGEA